VGGLVERLEESKGSLVEVTDVRHKSFLIELFKHNTHLRHKIDKGDKIFYGDVHNYAKVDRGFRVGWYSNHEEGSVECYDGSGKI
jgi:hypothetical protein